MNDHAEIDAARQLFARYGDAAWLLSNTRQPAQLAGPAIYLCDVDTGRTLLLETHHDALRRLSEREHIDEATYDQIRIALSILVNDLLTASSDIHPDTRRGVILGAAFCIAETRGFDLTRYRGSDVQHVLLRYRDASNGRYVFTPMPLFKAHPIPASELNASATHVLVSEHLNFPERFAGGPLLQYKERRRDVLAGTSRRPYVGAMPDA